MHQYKIEIRRYKEDGSVGELFTTIYADNQEQARLKCAEYENQHFIKEDGTKGFKMYKVNLYLLCYKLCADKAAFFAQFEA